MKPLLSFFMDVQALGMVADRGFRDLRFPQSMATSRDKERESNICKEVIIPWQEDASWNKA